MTVNNVMKYDVVVVGGGTAGCACAYNCAKLGLKTLLIEKNTYLGGSITSSLVIPAMKTSENAINTDFYKALYNKLKEYNGVITYSDGNNGWFNPELTKIALDCLLKEVGCNILLNKNIDKIEQNLSSYIVSIHDDNTYIDNNKLLVYIETKYLVDATGDAKICEILKSEFLFDNFEKMQPISLRFIMSGINVKKFSDWLMEYDKDRNVTTSTIIDGNIYLSTAYTWDKNVNWALRPIFEEGINAGIITEEDSNYFQIFSVAGTPDSIAFNCPRIIDNSLSESEAYISSRASILRLSKFCINYFPGFEKSYISSIADKLGIRLSKRVKAKYVYSKEDLVSGKQFENPVVISNYPIDVHSNKKDSSKLEKVNQEYQLPLESLIVKENLFVVGRCLSAEFEAQAALRIIPSCFSMGEGLAKYLAKKH